MSGPGASSQGQKEKICSDRCRFLCMTEAQLQVKWNGSDIGCGEALGRYSRD